MYVPNRTLSTAIRLANEPTYREPSRPISKRTPRLCLHGEPDALGPSPFAMAMILAAADKAADRALSGGFKTARSNQCQECFQVRSANGQCGCL